MEQKREALNFERGTRKIEREKTEKESVAHATRHVVVCVKSLLAGSVVFWLSFCEVEFFAFFLTFSPPPSSLVKVSL